MEKLTPLARVSKKIEPTGFCWLWKGKPEEDGYGSQAIDGKTWAAHRLVYTLLVGEVPEGLDLDHLCRVRICVNPDHLEPVTRKENLRRSHNIGKGDPWKNRRNSKALLVNRKACANGHILAELGICVYTSKGKTMRTCEACRRIGQCKHQHKKKGCTPACTLQTYPREATLST